MNNNCLLGSFATFSFSKSPLLEIYLNLLKISSAHFSKFRQIAANLFAINKGPFHKPNSATLCSAADQKWMITEFIFQYFLFGTNNLDIFIIFLTFQFIFPSFLFYQTALENSLGTPKKKHYLIYDNFFFVGFFSSIFFIYFYIYTLV